MKKLYTKMNLFGMLVVGILLTGIVININDNKIGDAVFLIVLMTPQLLFIFGNEIIEFVICKFGDKKEIK